MIKITVLVLVTILMGGCVYGTRQSTDEQGASSQNLTVGTVQKEIKIGMSGAQVAEVLGSPNIVSTDDQRREVWVYDKVATDTVRSSSSGWVFAVIAGGHSSSSSVSKTQRTLTIVIKFDDQGLVRDFAYHASKF